MEIDGHARQAIGLLTTVAVLSDEVVNHIEQGIVGRQGYVFGFVAVVTGDEEKGKVKIVLSQCCHFCIIALFPIG